MPEKNIKVETLRGVGYEGTQHPVGAILNMEAAAVTGLLKYHAVTVLNPDTVEDSTLVADTLEAETPTEELAIFDFLKEEQVGALLAAGFDSIEAIQKATKKDLEAVPTVGEATAKNLIKTAKEYEVVEG